MIIGEINKPQKPKITPIKPSSKEGLYKGNKIGILKRNRIKTIFFFIINYYVKIFQHLPPQIV